MGVGEIEPPSIYPAGSLDGNERPLQLQFPALQVHRAFLRSAPLNGASIPAGSSGWFCFGEFEIGEAIPSNSWLCGYRVELGPTNNNAGSPEADADFTNAANQRQWGNTSGTGAAVVVGINMTWCRIGEWVAGPGNVPYVEQQDSGGNVLRSSTFTTAEQWVFHFPTGKLSDAPIPAIYRSGQSTPLAVLLNPGMKVQAALVVARANVNGITRSDGIVGKIFVELTTTPIIAPRGVRG
jgi:hypothetical protein